MPRSCHRSHRAADVEPARPGRPMRSGVGGSLLRHDRDLRDRDPDGRVPAVARRPVLDVRLAGRRGAGLRRRREPRGRGPRRGAAVLDRLAARRPARRHHADGRGGRARTSRRTAPPGSRSTRSSSTPPAGPGWTCPARCRGRSASRGSWPSCCPTGRSRQVADDVWFPNGMVVLGDDTLVVAESHADRLTAWTITDAGELVDRRVWADLGPGSAPDGICADAEGAIWYASVPGQRCTRVAEGGEVLRHHRGRPRLLRVHARRRRRPHAVHRGQPLRRRSGASDGIVLTQPVDVPHAGRP